MPTVPETRSPRPVTLLGAGGHARVVLETLALLARPIAGVLDDQPAAVPALPRGIARLGRLAWADLPPDTAWMLALGDLVLRRRLLDAAPAGTPPAEPAVHPTAFVSPSASIGPGVWVGPRSVVHAGARVSAHAIINSGAIIEHDCVVGVNVHIGPGAILAGRVQLGPDALVGLGARVLPNLTLGHASRVGAGAIVTRDVLPGQTVITRALLAEPQLPAPDRERLA